MYGSPLYLHCVCVNLRRLLCLLLGVCLLFRSGFVVSLDVSLLLVGARKQRSQSEEGNQLPVAFDARGLVHAAAAGVVDRRGYDFDRALFGVAT